MIHLIEGYLRDNCVGRQKAVKAQVLADLFGTTLRDVNATIADLREQGKIIGSSKKAPHGYYLPANDEELRDCVVTYQSEVMKMLHVLKIWKRAIGKRISVSQQYEIRF